MLSLSRRMILFLGNRAQIANCTGHKQSVDLESMRNVLYRLQKRDYKKRSSLSVLFTPVPVKPETDSPEVGAELVGDLDKSELGKVITTFYRDEKVKSLAEENNLDYYLLQTGFASFRKYCLKEKLPPDLHVVLADVLRGAANHLDIFPYFLRHVKEMFPHLNCMEDLKKIGDFTSVASWFPDARKIKRKIIFHSGPTNSGKTYQALQRFYEAKSGIYCAPLKLLALEVFNKANEKGTPCDLVTGEEVIYVRSDEDASDHMSCTIEMCPIDNFYDVAIIDEIQMIKDVQRGGAWTRALLGLKANEIHLCGEESAVNIIDSILCTTNEELEVKKYERKSKLEIDEPLQNFSNIKEGDCVVCFSKSDIYQVTKILEDMGKEVAVIYGTLPPGTKLSQCKKFNDPEDPCKILVATDAIGMGLNLSIRRIIFHSLVKPNYKENGLKEMGTISVSQALQIAGRAGRFGTQYDTGYVTTYKASDLSLLKELLSQKPDPILAAGLQPTVNQIEMFSFYLPNLSLSNLLEIFVNLSTVDESLYFICHLEELRALASLINHVPLPLKTQYIFCCAPVQRKSQLNNVIFVKFARLYSENKIISLNWVCNNISWPLKMPTNIQEFQRAEEVHEVLELYLWLSNRFPDYFPDADRIRQLQREVDGLIQKCIKKVASLYKNSEQDVMFLPKFEGRYKRPRAHRNNNTFVRSLLNDNDSPTEKPKSYQGNEEPQQL